MSVRKLQKHPHTETSTIYLQRAKQRDTLIAIKNVRTGFLLGMSNILKIKY